MKIFLVNILAIATFAISLSSCSTSPLDQKKKIRENCIRVWGESAACGPSYAQEKNKQPSTQPGVPSNQASSETNRNTPINPALAKAKARLEENKNRELTRLRNRRENSRKVIAKGKVESSPDQPIYIDEKNPEELLADVSKMLDECKSLPDNTPKHQWSLLKTCKHECQNSKSLSGWKSCHISHSTALKKLGFPKQERILFSAFSGGACLESYDTDRRSTKGAYNFSRVRQAYARDFFSGKTFVLMPFKLSRKHYSNAEKIPISKGKENEVTLIFSEVDGSNRGTLIEKRYNKEEKKVEEKKINITFKGNGYCKGESGICFTVGRTGGYADKDVEYYFIGKNADLLCGAQQKDLHTLKYKTFAAAYGKLLTQKQLQKEQDTIVENAREEQDTIDENAREELVAKASLSENTILKENRFYKIFRETGDNWCSDTLILKVVYKPENFLRIREKSLKSTGSRSGLQNNVIRIKKKYCPNASKVRINLYPKGTDTIESFYFYDSSNSERLKFVQEGGSGENIVGPGISLSPTQEGLLVDKVRKGGPAWYQAGIRTGDLITQIGWDRDVSVSKLLKLIDKKQPGDTIFIRTRGPKDSYDKLLAINVDGLPGKTSTGNEQNYEYVEEKHDPNSSSEGNRHVIHYSQGKPHILASNVPNWCSDVARVDKIAHGVGVKYDFRLRGGDWQIFKNNWVPPIREQCPSAKKVIFTNFVPGFPTPVNRFEITDLDDKLKMKMVGINGNPFAKSLEEAREIALKNTTRCDQLAAHPEDLDKPHGLVGVKDDSIDSERAIDFCLNAIEKNPNSHRLRFQLARALLSSGLAEQAAKILKKTTEAGHAPSQYYLANLYEKGQGVPADKNRANDLFKNAVDNGFDPEKIKKMEEVASLDISGLDLGYSRSMLVENIYKFSPRDIMKDNGNMLYNWAYLIGLAEAFNKLCPEAYTKKEFTTLRAVIYKPDTYTYYGPTQQIKSHTWIKNKLNSLNWENVKRGSKLTSMDLDDLEIAKITKDAYKDAKSLASRMQCEGKIFQRFKDSLTEFIMIAN